jgi:uncharacterized membrane protein
MADPSENAAVGVERSVIDAWAQAGVLTVGQYERSLELAGLRPGTVAWTVFLERLLAAMGALLVGAAVVYFIAHNWDVLGRFGKFVLLDIGIVGAVAVAWWRGANSLSGRASLWLATVILGGLLALIGQTYQTGADPYELFLVWALLALPWTLASNWAPGWMLLLVLANLATALYFGEIFRPFGLFFSLGEDALWLALWILNVAATVLGEFFARRAVAWGSAWLIRMAAALAIAAQTVLALLVIGDHHVHHPALLLATAITFAGLLWLYRSRRLDLPILGLGAASAIVLVEWLIVRHLFSGYTGNGLMVLALALVGMSAAAAVWLTRLARRERLPADGAAP